MFRSPLVVSRPDVEIARDAEVISPVKENPKVTATAEYLEAFELTGVTQLVNGLRTASAVNSEYGTFRGSADRKGDNNDGVAGWREL